MPTERDPRIDAPPITEVTIPKSRGRGRPAHIAMPPLPTMAMSEQEQKLQTFFVAAYVQDYPDLSQTDLILLHLASLEYVKYLRVAQEEFETGKVISMARQHPSVNMRALLDQMGATRKARNVGKQPKDDSDDDAREAFLSMSKN